ncbi:signal peptidase I [uncultured Tyzzerella sp.]|uniref:signal peptidase I n=1 Tax=uncultured Tyzzerella sp. TaxID=2321398 RepID=UPI002943A574|nr:signal peptidase I [uncultured Tyzzerella sp.]
MVNKSQKDEVNNQDDKNNQNTITKTQKIKKELIDITKTIIIAIIVAFIITHFIIVNAFVPTGSMKNTIMPSDRLIAFRLSYLFSEPQRDDIIVFKPPDDESVLYVKRIIGLPGETINIIDGKVYINDSQTPLPDEYIMEDMLGSFGPYTVPQDSYFVLGDNRNDSQDSRYWENTFLPEDNILGKVLFKYYPKIEPLWNK